MKNVLKAIQDYSKKKGDKKLEALCSHALALEEAVKELNEEELEDMIAWGEMKYSIRPPHLKTTKKKKK